MMSKCQNGEFACWTSNDQDFRRKYGQVCLYAINYSTASLSKKKIGTISAPSSKEPNRTKLPINQVVIFAAQKKQRTISKFAI